MALCPQPATSAMSATASSARRPVPTAGQVGTAALVRSCPPGRVSVPGVVRLYEEAPLALCHSVPAGWSGGSVQHCLRCSCWRSPARPRLPRRASRCRSPTPASSRRPRRRASSTARPTSSTSRRPWAKRARPPHGAAGGTVRGEARAPDAAGRLTGHFFYVTGSTHFSIYDVPHPLHPKLTSRVDFPCSFENEDVTGNDDLLVYSDFTTSGALYVYDVRNKREPKLVSDTPDAGTHTMECVENCRYLYGSYHRVGPKGPLSGGEAVDLADPAKPKVLGDWTAEGVLPSQKVHDATEVSPGRILTASAPIEYLDTTADRAKPRVLARSDTPDDKRYHTAIWPQGGEDRFMMAMFETNGTPNCGAGSGDFTVFDATQWQRTGKFKPLHSFYLSTGDFED